MDDTNGRPCSTSETDHVNGHMPMPGIVDLKLCGRSLEETTDVSMLAAIFIVRKIRAIHQSDICRAVCQQHLNNIPSGKLSQVVVRKAHANALFEAILSTLFCNEGVSSHETSRVVMKLFFSALLTICSSCS
jgi:hypothetical protein